MLTDFSTNNSCQSDCYAIVLSAETNVHLRFVQQNYHLIMSCQMTDEYTNASQNVDKPKRRQKKMLDLSQNVDSRFSSLQI